MRKLRILALMHEQSVPPDSIHGVDPKEIDSWRAEYDVCSTLSRAGHEVLKLGVRDALSPIRKTVEEWRPHVTFNLLEEFRDEAIFDAHVVSYMELLRQPYTGCNPRGLTLARDKALSKKILAFHRIRVPTFAVFPRGRKVRRPKFLGFPLIVKSLIEEASLGIARASLVETEEKLEERVRFVHDSIGTDAIVEQFIDGRELYVGVLGNERARVFPTWELLSTKGAQEEPLIATRKAKWDREYQDRHGITTQAAKLPPELHARVVKLSKRIYRVLGLTGYARLDYRLDSEGGLFLLEANPNPNIAREEDFAESAKAAKLSYRRLLQRIVNLGLRRGADGDAIRG